MEFFNESNQELSVSIPQSLNQEITNLLIRNDGQEDLLFGFWLPSVGLKRRTALLKSILLPLKEDRNIHGNVSFNLSYFKRTCEMAQKNGWGIVFMHSHPSPGWQTMSTLDVKAETKISPAVDTLTNLPLLGLTVGSDGVWSARFWPYINSRYQMKWVKFVKVIGNDFNIFINPHQKIQFIEKEFFKRTISVWGIKNQEILSNLRIGIVGLGSVGSIVAETLARIGIRNLTLIDYDRIEDHNLDRLLGATKRDTEKYKIDVLSKSIKKSSPLKRIHVLGINKNLSDSEAYKNALDCDLIFCCADKPRARYILNHIAYAHLIPVINGGILAEVEDKELKFADWELSIIAPDRPCMQCLKAYKSSDVMLEMDGKLEDPEYIKGVPVDSLYRKNQNVMPFSMNLSSLEVLQFVAYVTGIANFEYYGIQRYRFKQAFLSNYTDKKCNNNCDFQKSVSLGDTQFSPI